jgi:hypothetical protein
MFNSKIKSDRALVSRAASMLVGESAFIFRVKPQAKFLLITLNIGISHKNIKKIIN